MAEQPKPGSIDAGALGCTCPIIDNHYGNGMPYPDGPRFWISGDCPIHATPSRPAEAGERRGERE